MVVSIRDLQAHLEEYVERAAQGETIVIAEDGKPVAEIVPPQVMPLTDHLRDLARRGLVVMPTSPRLVPVPEGAAMSPGQSLTDILLEQRRDERLLR